MKEDFRKIGLKKDQMEEFASYDNMFLGRVSMQNRNLYKVNTDKDEVLASVSGKFIYETLNDNDYPCVGDFVVLDRNENTSGNAIIYKVLKRNTIIKRLGVGSEVGLVQNIATNVDVCFICMSLNEDFNLRRLERYLSVVWESGAKPVVVATKSDLCMDIEQKLFEITEAALGVDVIATTKLDESYQALLQHIKDGDTATFIGSSGVGKSSIINKLIGEDYLDTGGIREDDGKGKHTSTRRELIVLESFVLIDTPGMRELAGVNSDLETTYEEIVNLIKKCKFNNCTHKTEPNCAVREAIKLGIITEERFKNFQKLERERTMIENSIKSKEKKMLQKYSNSKNVKYKKQRKFNIEY